MDEIRLTVSVLIHVDDGGTPSLSTVLDIVDVSTVGYGEHAEISGCLDGGVRFAAEVDVDMRAYRDGVLEAEYVTDRPSLVVVSSRVTH